MPLPDGKPARIMVVTAHPVDAFDNTGGTCAEHISQGDHVTAVICTSGIYVHNERLKDELRKPESERDPAVLSESPEAYAARKRDEAEKSLGCFGITDVVLLPYDDGSHALEPGMIEDLEMLIRDRKPHVILQQDPLDGAAVFDDHALVGAATSLAIEAAGRVRFGDPRPPWEPVEVYLLGTYGINTSPFGNRHARVDVFVDVTKHYEAKVRAHQYIVSQGQNIGWGQKRIEGIEGHAGIFAGTSYAEAFVRVTPPVCETLPINRKRYEDLQLSSAERFKKNHQLLGAFVPEADGSYAWGLKPKA
jgi:LmbE family N-acetylglucosaminyl deacetylase